jgi:hypothetical protein
MIYLHIGRGKSGSTTLQHALIQNRDSLSAAGITLPRDAISNNGHNLALFKAINGDSNFQWAIDELHMASKIISSSEFLFQVKPQAIDLLKTLINGREITIIVYIREYVSWYLSLYNQATRGGKNTKPFDDYFNYKLGFVSVRTSLSSWADKFGWNNIRVRYLDEIAASGGIVNDLASVIGHPLVVGPDKNISPSWIEIELYRALCLDDGIKYKLNKSPKLPTVIRNLVDDSLREYEGDIESIGYYKKDQVACLDELYKNDCRWIFENTGIPVPSCKSNDLVIRGEKSPSINDVPSDFRELLIRNCSKYQGIKNSFLSDAIVNVLQVI